MSDAVSGWSQSDYGDNSQHFCFASDSPDAVTLQCICVVLFLLISLRAVLKHLQCIACNLVILGLFFYFIYSCSKWKLVDSFPLFIFHMQWNITFLLIKWEQYHFPLYKSLVDHSRFVFLELELRIQRSAIEREKNSWEFSYIRSMSQHPFAFFFAVKNC